MTLKNKSIVVLLSGGLDSSTVTGIAKKSEAKIFGLSFDYGQRHKKELNSASIIAKHFDIDEFKIIKLDLSLCCLLYTSPSPRDLQGSRMPSSA